MSASVQKLCGQLRDLGQLFKQTEALYERVSIVDDVFVHFHHHS